MPLSPKALVHKTLTVILDAVEHGTLATVESRLDALLKSDRPAAMTICKIDAERRMVYGWASVSTVEGQLLVDRQNDVLPTPEMVDMAHAFMEKRAIGDMHSAFEDIGELRDSIALDKSVQDALGIDLGMEGWFVGVYVKKDSTWARVKSGDLTGFSIGGHGSREPWDTDTLKRITKGGSGSKLSRTALFSDVLAALKGA